MMKHRITLPALAFAVVASAAASAACGGASADDTTTPTDQAAATPVAGEDPKAGEHGEHAKLTPELDAFHEVLAPRWHAAAGPQRKKDTCAAVAEFKIRASAVASATAPPSVDGTKWSESGAALTASVTSLETACAGTDDKAFDTAFTAVHDRFHAAMELVGGEHGEHGEAGEHGEHKGHH